MPDDQKQPQPRKKFDINEGADTNTVRLPNPLPDGIGADVVALDEGGYVAAYERSFQEVTAKGFHRAIQELTDLKPVDSDQLAQVAKSLGVPPTAFAYSRINYMPDPNAQGILPWPGIAPEALGKIARENVAPQLIIGMRCDDILRYSNLSDKLWRPGWMIELADPREKPTEAALRDMREAEKFLLNSNIETGYAEARARDGKRLNGFQRFLSAGTRDWLTYDELAIWTDMDHQGKVKAYTLLPAGQIRLATSKGYNGDPAKFAVGVDEGAKVISTFTRDQLTFICRNPRTNADTSGDLYATGYGYPEIEIAVRLIQGFQNMIDMNVDVFSRNGIPPGLLTITGATQRQLDFINRIWTNIKRGITKKWALPVIGMPAKDSKIELIDLSGLEGKDAQYQNWQNMLAGMFCVVYRFPSRRLGFRISGQGKDADPMPDSTVEKVDEDDPGLAPLLGHWETALTEYVIRSRWPHLKHKFTGANPKQDAREYEAKRAAQTWNEARMYAGLKPVEEECPTEHKPLAEIMGIAPIDANLSGVFQTLAAIWMQSKLGVGSEGGNQKMPGNNMTEKKDPAKSEKHGHQSGVRRDSAKEN